jgi:universal stress protein E
VRPIRRILVAVKDPSVRMPAGVAKAVQLARALSAELVLFHAISTPLCLEGDLHLLDEGLPLVAGRIRARSLESLQRIERRLRRTRIKTACSVQWDYPVYEAIIREAVRVDADLIVAERHAGRHIAAGLLQLTDWELLRLSPVPVLLVKRGGLYRRPRVLAALDPDHSYSKPAQLDGEILRAATVFTRALRGTLHAVHAYMPLPLAVVAEGALSDEEVERVRAQSAQSAAAKLEQLVSPLGIPQARRHLIARHATDAIEQVAAETRSALLVMGAISRSGLKRLLIGNTAEKVIDHVNSDLLIIKPAGLIKRPPQARRPVRYSLFKPAPPVY